MTTIEAPKTTPKEVTTADVPTPMIHVNDESRWNGDPNDGIALCGYHLTREIPGATVSCVVCLDLLRQAAERSRETA